MKTNLFKIMLLALFLLPLLGRGLGGGCALFAQNGITISNLATGAGTVTFEVRWDKAAMPVLWVDSAWVFVDYHNNGMTERLSLAAGATLTETSAPGVGRVAYVPDNDKGVWVIGNARTASIFSATVQLLTATADLSNACAYASNYPPVGLYTSDTELSFTGSLPYIIILKKDADGTPETWTVDDSPLFTVPAGYTAQSFTDATGVPGTFSHGCAPGEISGQENSD
jgi:hypothetical protein